MIIRRAFLLLLLTSLNFLPVANGSPMTYQIQADLMSVLDNGTASLTGVFTYDPNPTANPFMTFESFKVTHTSFTNAEPMMSFTAGNQTPCLLQDPTLLRVCFWESTDSRNFTHTLRLKDVELNILDSEWDYFINEGSPDEDHFSEVSRSFTPVPEPSSLLLMGSGLLVMGMYIWRRERQQHA